MSIPKLLCIYCNNSLYQDVNTNNNRFFVCKFCRNVKFYYNEGYTKPIFIYFYTTYSTSNSGHAICLDLMWKQTYILNKEKEYYNKLNYLVDITPNNIQDKLAILKTFI